MDWLCTKRIKTLASGLVLEVVACNPMEHI
jgi:hypothetical protein